MLKFFLKKHLTLLIGLLLTSLIFITNYKPDTYLMGWDNLQTELNPVLGVKRAFFGVWQEYQSFGLLGGLSHSADLIRAIFILLISSFLPNHLVRYFFHHLMILIGFMGAVKFCQVFFPEGKKTFSPLLAGLVYIFNFGAIQILGLPWEAFSVFFAFLPWQIWIFLKTLTDFKKKYLLNLFIINLLATPQAYIQTLFISYMLFLIFFWFGIFLKNLSWTFFKRSLWVFGAILAVNLFWLLPQLYFLKTSSYIVTEAKANVLSTDDLKFINKDKGDLLSYIKLEGFYYELRDPNQVFIFDSWKKHFNIFPISLAPYLFFFIAVLGFFFLPKFKLAFLFTSLLVAFALLITTFPFSLLHDLISQSNFLGQIFRSPFTKFINLQIFLFSFLFSVGVNTIIKFISKKGKWALYLLPVTLILIFITYAPVFAGNYFPGVVKKEIPKEYFALFNFFKSQDKNQRVALLPEATYWGWFTHSWGYNGSGFLWYGIEQPVVSRNFDVWSDKSEGYFWELKTALEAEDTASIKRIFDKYGIDFLVYDKSLLPIASSIKAIQYERIDNLLKIIDNISLVKKWNYLSVYKINHQKPIQSFVWAATSLPNIGPAVKLTNLDNAYVSYGDYQTDANNNLIAFYPFLDLFSQAQRNSANWQLLEDQFNWYLVGQLPNNFADFKLISENKVQEFLISPNNSVIEFSYPLSVNTQNNSVTVEFPKILISSFDLVNAQPINCGYGFEEIEKEQPGTTVSLIAKKGAAACLSFKNQNLDQRNGYLVKLQNKNNQGQRLLFYVLDSTKDQPYLEDRVTDNIEYYILPPKYQYGLGYEFNFRNTSYQNFPSINTLEDVSVFLMPYSKLKQMSFVNTKTTVKQTNYFSNFTAKKQNYFFYQVSSVPKDSYLVLNQAFHDGWRAFQFNGLLPVEINNHVLINNWANGWEVNSAGVVIIFFWPQLLQFLGFGILILTIHMYHGRGTYETSGL